MNDMVRTCMQAELCGEGVEPTPGGAATPATPAATATDAMEGVSDAPAGGTARRLAAAALALFPLL